MDKNIDSTVPDFSSGKPFSKEYFNEKLWTFMNNIWEDPAEYKVLMARRMFNLNYVLTTEWAMSDSRQYLTEGIMSNTAFLLSARSIADRYVYKKSFSRILICDDIMLHGRGIINLLETFRKLIIDRLKECNVEVNEKQLDLDLYRAVNVFVFVRNSDKGILFDEEKYRLYAAQVLPMNRLRELSLQISDYLLSYGVANTSYVISARLPWYQIRDLFEGKNGESSAAFQYKGRKQHVFLRARELKILETMRLFYPGEDKIETGVITSLPIIGDIPRDFFNILCRLTAQYMEQNIRYSQIAVYLRMESPELAKSKAQLLSFLYSILSLADFCRQKLSVEGRDLYKILVSGDFNKIISNFDRGDIFRYEILDFFKNICKDKSTGTVLWEFLYRTVQRTIVDQKKNMYLYGGEFRHIKGPEKSGRREIYENAEDIFYEVGMDAEYDAFRYVLTKTKYDAKNPGFDIIPFRQYMQIMARNRDGFGYSIGCLLGLMDSGLISMNLEAVSNMEEQTVRTVLKAGELATYVLPRRFSVFIPALSVVESHYTKIGKYITDVISSFIDYLQGHCYEHDGYTDLRDVQILKSLKKKKLLLLYLYSAGQKFEDWDIDLRNERKYFPDRFALEGGDLTNEEELVRKNHYLLVAKRFVNQQYIYNNYRRKKLLMK